MRVEAEPHASFLQLNLDRQVASEDDLASPKAHPRGSKVGAKILPTNEQLSALRLQGSIDRSGHAADV